jgi:alkyl hydroperoxide reductase subunit AhpF
MTLLQENDRKQLQEIFAQRLEEPVTIHLYTQQTSPLALPITQCQTCRETGELMDEVAGLSGKLSVEVHDFVEEGNAARERGIERIPALVFEGQNRGTVRYFGIPAGYEFSVLVESLIDLSRGTTALSAATREQLAQLPKPVHLEILVTPT